MKKILLTSIFFGKNLPCYKSKLIGLNINIRQQNKKIEKKKQKERKNFPPQTS